MGYMDNLSQGYQNTYGGGYTQMYRKQPQTQIGGSQIKAPMRISLDRMYGGQPTTLPQMAAAGQYNIPLPGSYQPTAGYGDYDQYLEDQGWVREYNVEAQDYVWRPGNATEGQIYQDSLGENWIFENGTWIKYTESSMFQLPLPPETPPASQTPGPSGDLYAPPGSLLPDTLIANWHGSGLNYRDWLLSAKMQHENYEPESEAERNYIENNLNLINQELERIQEVTPDIENWQDQLTSLMEQLEAGELDYLDENGNLDVTALREGNNIMGNWLADVLETSYETGLIQSDFFDEEGNLVPELESMAAFFESDPQAMENWNRYNKQLAMHAIASGHSVESAYYTEATANAVVAYGAQVADQITQTLSDEMKMQYEYIANSFKSAMDEAAEDYATEDFINKMNNAYDAIQQQYQMGLEQLAAQISEGQSGMMGSIFSGALSFIVNMALTLF